uniref:Protein kinase domain-containing protein n=1 Tax=Oryza punctata TaxID=4537 RepID=A0A0E0MN00_ORYPU
MAIGGQKQHNLVPASLYLAGGWLLLLLSASPCEARWLKDKKSVWLTAVVATVVAVVVAVVLIVIAYRMFRRMRRVAAAAAEEEDYREQKMFYGGYFAPARVVDNPMSINANMVRSPERMWWSPARRAPASPALGAVSSPPNNMRSAVGLAQRHIASLNPKTAPVASSSQPRTTNPLPGFSPALPVRLKEFSYQSLAEATSNFHKSNELGRGRSGKVFKGAFRVPENVDKDDSKIDVAIKRFDKNIDISQIRGDLKRKYSLKHRNLVTLLGYGLHKGRLYLVYDLMHCGSLDQRLYSDVETVGADDGQPSRHVMSWDERCNIIKDAALGLYQLHVSNAFHGSVKASNILLEPGLHGRRARLGDFTYSKVAPAPQEARTSTAATTPSLETDMLDFGALILEVVCGRRRSDCGVPKFTSLLDWVWALHAEGRLPAAVDEKLAGNFDSEHAVNLLLVGLACTHEPQRRPTIDEVSMVVSGTKSPPEVSAGMRPPREVHTSYDEIFRNIRSTRKACC